MTTANCHCGSGKSFSNCCKPYLNNIKKTPTAETLMRSRYTAYCTQEADYLVATTHSSTRKFHNRKDILQWSKNNQWLRLEIVNASENIVEFKAYFLDNQLKATVHHEKSTFVKEEGNWYYVDGVFINHD